MCDLAGLRKLLEKERKRLESFEGEGVFARVLHVSHGIATLEIPQGEAPSLFEPGDPVGLVVPLGPRREVKELGVTLYSHGNLLAVLLHCSLNNAKRIIICDYEPLIAYDLQLELLDLITSGKNSGEHVKISHWEAVEAMLKGRELGALKRQSLRDKRDVKNGFSLDDSQVAAVEAALGLEDGELLLIVGPPGTGKTRVIAKVAAELAERGERVLITSHTNRAVDNAIELLPVEKTLRVGRPEKVLPWVRPYLLSYKVREKAGELKEIEKKLEKRTESMRKLEEDLRKTRNEYERETLKRALKKYKREVARLLRQRNEIVSRIASELAREIPVVGSTLVKSQLLPLADVSFDAVVIDEASQASLTLALLGMVKGKKWIIVGDHKQLLPIFKVKTPCDHEQLSAFTRLRGKYKQREVWLTVNYRSHTELVEFASKHVYEGKIKPGPGSDSKLLKLRQEPRIKALDPAKPIVFVHVKGGGVYDGKAKSMYNEEEGEAVAEIVRELLECGAEDIGVITPYRAQKRRLAENLRRVRSGAEVSAKAEIDTVDAFQGREKEVVVFSIVATGPGLSKFAADQRRLNVAFTRARRKLVVVGKGGAVFQHGKGTLLYKLLEHCYKRESIYDWSSREWMRPRKD